MDPNNPTPSHSSLEEFLNLPQRPFSCFNPEATEIVADAFEKRLKIDITSLVPLTPLAKIDGVDYIYEELSLEANRRPENLGQLIQIVTDRLHQPNFPPIDNRGEPIGPTDTNILVGTEIARKYQIQSFISRDSICCIYKAINEAGEEFAIAIGETLSGKNAVSISEEIHDANLVTSISPDECIESVVSPVEHSGILFQQEIDQMLIARHEKMNAMKGGSFLESVEIVKHQGRPVQVMPFVAGPTLRQKMRRLETLNINPIRDLVDDLMELQKNGLSHGDLKPSKLIVSSPLNYKVVGPAVSLGGGSSDKLTTPAFYPFTLSGESSQRSDLRAIGAILYEISTGALPFPDVVWKPTGDASTDKESLKYYKSYIPAQEHNSDVESEIVNMIDRCLLDDTYNFLKLRTDLTDYINS